MKSTFFSNIIISQCSTVFELFPGEYKSLLIWRNAFLILDFLFDVVNAVTWFNFKGNGFTGESLNKDLHYIWYIDINLGRTNLLNLI